MDGIVVDGDLSDWSQHPGRTLIEPTDPEAALEAKDFAASFRAAYSLETGSLYIAVEVVDDIERAGEEPDGAWTSRDTHLLYIDRHHRPEGSGNILYQAGQGFREIGAAGSAWDPFHGEPSWKDAEVRVRRQETTTVYEWRVFVGKDLAANRTVGLDHVLADPDEEGAEPLIALWGEGFSKSANSYRLGDLVLLEKDAQLGALKGRVEWAGNLEEPLPNRVRITSVDHPELWTQAVVDSEGSFSLQLPSGDYWLSSAFTLSKPFRTDANNAPLHVDAGARVRATVIGKGASSAEPLVLSTDSPPGYLFRKTGVLRTFEPSQALMIDTFLEAYRLYYDVPGVSAALVRKGELVYHRTFGVRNTLTQDPVEATTLFEAASITKPVFAFAVLRLAERGIIDLDKPLDQYLPFPNISGDPRSKTMTARMILTHRSGLPNWAWGGPGGWEEGGTLELLFQPGTRFEYSGEAFNYLGRVIEEITGKELATVLHEEVSVPMGLKNAYFALDEVQAATASIGHFSHLPVLRERANRVSPASSLHTEARDFSKFLIGMIQGKGLSSASYREMFKPQLVIPEEKRIYDNDWIQSLGLGIFLQDTPLGLLAEHGGNNGDFDCKFGVLPDSGDGYVIFTNSNVGDELVRAFELFLLTGKP